MIGPYWGGFVPRIGERKLVNRRDGDVSKYEGLGERKLVAGAHPARTVELLGQLERIRVASPTDGRIELFDESDAVGSRQIGQVRAEQLRQNNGVAGRQCEDRRPIVKVGKGDIVRKGDTRLRIPPLLAEDHRIRRPQRTNAAEDTAHPQDRRRSRLVPEQRGSRTVWGARGSVRACVGPPARTLAFETFFMELISGIEMEL